MSKRSAFFSLAALSIAVAVGIVVLWRNAGPVRSALAANGDESALGPAAGPNESVAVLAGGCYWGMEYVFDHVRGVREVTSGYAIPATVEGGRFGGSAEAVRIEYDTTVVSYRQLLDIFFSVAHDPTQLNRQGPDVGPNYRSIVFPASDAQRGLVRSYIDSLGAMHIYPRPVVTEVAALQFFQAAEASQQHYAERHPHSAYIVYNDVPKVRALKQRFPALYRERR
ncbi:MAG TPA: peptide-methionine (S)-S-oxide reductase MsrA [Gemmatimonadaceae bacterium]|nr:peptide-methionine (S)-S-oxide reductase MsrA [Gemmatimonadaceae bacterium]